VLVGCSFSPRAGSAQPSGGPAIVDGKLQTFEIRNRLTWGADETSIHANVKQGLSAFLDGPLNPPPDDDVPAAIAKRIAALSAELGHPVDIAVTLQRERHAIRDSQKEADANIAAKAAYVQTLSNSRRTTIERSLLRDIYSRNQLLEQMTWFWLNHFNVFAGKADVAAWIGDYEENAIRAHALGHFRDLLRATVHHPAMLIYLDNVQNARGHLNENYARELMELHTLGIGGGYSQADVEALARILTGLGVNETGAPRKMPAPLAAQYRLDGLFEFDPRRHDYANKVFLGQPIRRSGLAETDEALDLLSRSPATAKFVSRKLAMFFVSDQPTDQLVEQMAQTFRRTDGDIPSILRTLFASSEFAASLGTKFKDPMHFLISAVRVTHGADAITNLQPVEDWLNLLGEPVFGCQDPNGYPLTAAAWSGSGAMLSRIRIAFALGSARTKLFGAPGSSVAEDVSPPQIANTSYYDATALSLGPATRAALSQANPTERFDMLFLSSPEFMYR
jgi:uncharacterized protein (DUF1800 family)